MFGLFDRRIDGDADFKALLLEELVQAQLKYRDERAVKGESAWMGFPWCMNLLKLRLRAEKLKASELVLGSIIHASTMLAAEIDARRSAERAEARSRPIVDAALAKDRFASFSLLVESLTATPVIPVAMLPSERASVLRQANEACHVMLCLLDAPNVQEVLSDRELDEHMARLTPAKRMGLLREAKAELAVRTQRAKPYSFRE